MFRVIGEASSRKGKIVRMCGIQGGMILIDESFGGWSGGPSCWIPEELEPLDDDARIALATVRLSVSG